MAATSGPGGGRRRRRGARRPSGRDALRALGTSALALAGGAGHAAADGRPEQWQFEYNTSTYAEDDLPAADALAGSERERYRVEMHQFLISGPLPVPYAPERWDVGAELVLESMSGASPIYTLPDAAGNPIQVMSEATIEDDRSDLNLSLNYHLDGARIGLGTGYSVEDDYSALSFSTNAERQFNEKNTTLGVGLGVSFDSISPTPDPDLVGTQEGDKSKRSFTLFASAAQLLDRRASVQSSLTYRFQNGYLSDPYKEVFVQGALRFEPDSRPRSRHQFAWLTRYRRHVEEVNASFHLDYQLQLDTWGVTSHTLELALHKSLGESFSILPSLRWYSQAEADFYVPFFLSDPGAGDHSSDYRLGAFGALALGIAAEYRFRTRWTGDSDIALKISWERYASSEDLSHQDAGREIPGLVNWSLFSIGVGVRF